MSSSSELADALASGSHSLAIVGTIELHNSLVLGPTASGLRLWGHSPDSALVLSATLGNSVIVLRQATNVTISNLRLSYTTPTTNISSWGALPAAVSMTDSVNCVLEQLDVEGGVMLAGGFGSRLRRSEISNTRGTQNGTCIYVPYCGNSSTLSSCNLVVHDNFVHDCRYDNHSVYDASSQGVLLGAIDGSPHGMPNGGCVVGVVVHNNNISSTDEMGIRISNDLSCANVLNQVVFNKIVDWGQLSNKQGGDAQDSGCLYTYGHWFSPGNNVSFNLCISTNASWGQNGMYLDDASSGQTFIGNYFINATAGSALKLNGGQYNTVHSTVVIGGSNFGFANCRGVRPPLNYIYTCENPNTGVRWMSILEGYSYLSPPWSLAFPFYRGWCTNTTAGPHEAPCAPSGAPAGYECASLSRGNDIRNFAGVSMVRNGSFVIPTSPGFPYLNWSSACPQYVVDQDFNNVNESAQFFYDDPEAVFVDPGHGDFTLRDDSPVYRDMPSFVHIPFRSIGIGGNPWWE